METASRRDPENSKPLVRLHGKPLLEHVIRGAHRAGIERFVIVVGYRGHLIHQWWKNSPVRDLPVTWVENPEYHKDNGVSVLRAKPKIHEKFLLFMADHIFESETARTWCTNLAREKSSSASTRTSMPYSTWTMPPR